MGKQAMEIRLNVHGLAPGLHGIHIHDVGKCEIPEFKSAMDKLETPITFKQGADFQKFFETDAHRLAEGVRKVGRIEQK